MVIPRSVYCMKRMSVVLALSCITVSSTNSFAKIVRTSASSSYQDAVNKCVSGDVLIIDSDPSGKTIKDPPSDLQIIGGSANWEITQEVSDLILVNHTPKITQTGGKLRRVISNSSLGRGSRLTHVDSCFFHMGNMSREGINYEIDGFLRHSTFGFNGSFMGASTINFNAPKSIYNETWIKHASNFVINATDPVGDGSGTLVCNIISHGQVDWTPVHIINGRGIMVSHINSEYCEWADPFLSIENGVECASVHHNPGGHQSGLDWDSYLDLADGTRGYAWMGNRWGTWRIGGMNNSAIGGTNYVAIRTSLTGSAWVSMLTRDPYMTKWNAVHGSGINFALALKCMNLGASDWTEMKESDHTGGARANAISALAACTTKFIDASGQFITGRLKSRTLRPGPSLYRPFAPQMPALKLDSDGPGTNASSQSGAQIAALVNAGQTVYLGPGTYTIPTTLNGGTVWGAGKDKTILKFASDQICTRDKINLYNLTIEGGTIGYKQDKPSCHGLRSTNLRFKGQSEVGMAISCVQNCYGLLFTEFDGCVRGIRTDGNCQTVGMNDNKAIDKMNLYGCVFKNLTTGLSLSGGTDGFISLIGCVFQNISGTGANLSSKGNYVAGCEFINCGTAINARYSSTIHNCVITGTASSKGITGAFDEIISCSINGCATAIEVGSANAVVSDIESDGAITKNSTTWVGMSSFSNLKCVDGAYHGDVNLTEWVDNSVIRIDQTPPAEPTGLQVKASGAHNLITWERSSDAETGIMQYIIERDGKEIGRTNFNYSANYHVLNVSGRWDGTEGWPGAGVYKDPRPNYLDSNAAASGTASYKVVALNFAQLRSDGKETTLQMWTHTVRPHRLTGEINGVPKRLSDSLYVVPGLLSLTQASGGKAYTAARYRPLSESGITRGVHALSLSARPPRASGAMQGALLRMARKAEIYTLMGRRVATFHLDGMNPVNEADFDRAIANLRLADGTYILRRAGAPLRVVDLR